MKIFVRYNANDSREHVHRIAKKIRESLDSFIEVEEAYQE